MTDYDLRTRKALRRVMLLEYGFGPETLQQRKVCPACGRATAPRTRTAPTAARPCRRKRSMTSTAPATAAASTAAWW